MQVARASRARPPRAQRRAAAKPMPVPAAAVTSTVLPASRRVPGGAGRRATARGHRSAGRGSRGRPSARSAIMLRWIWFEPRVDRVGAREEEQALEARRARTGAPSAISASGAEHVHRELAEARGARSPRRSCDHAPRAASSRARAREHAQRVVAHDLEARSTRRRCAGGSADPRAAPLRRATATISASSLRKQHLLAERRGAALEGERAHRHLPAVAGRADDVRPRRCARRRRTPR